MLGLGSSMRTHDGHICAVGFSPAQSQTRKLGTELGKPIAPVQQPCVHSGFLEPSVLSDSELEASVMQCTSVTITHAHPGLTCSPRGDTLFSALGDVHPCGTPSAMTSFRSLGSLVL